MKGIGFLLGWLLLGVNGLITLCLLLCAYSSYLHPTRFPILSCCELAFPVFLFLTVIFLLFWLIVYYRYAVLSLLSLIICAPAIHLYMPIRLHRSEAPEGSIKILSYNIMGFENDHPDTPDNPNLILHYLKDPQADIICLQEYTAGGRLKQAHIDEVLADYPYHDIYQIEKSGNKLACYSRFPILSSQGIVYKSENNGSVIYMIKVDNDTIMIINNHLESNKLTSDDKAMYIQMIKSPETSDVKEGSRLLIGKLAEANAIRSRQSDTIASIIRQRSVESLIVCGDFNTSPLSYSHRVIAEGLIDAFVESGNGMGISYNKNGFYFRIDNILISQNLQSYQCTVDRSIKNSDHYPIWCYLSKK